MMRELDYKKLQFGRLFASVHDFAQANFCARYLLKKGWHSKPWERRGTIYQQQTAFVTNLIVAYARPFVGSKGWPTFPSKLIPFNAEQWEIHRRFLSMRHKIFAHSDSIQFEFIPWNNDHFSTTIERVPFAVLSATETQHLEVMTRNLITVTNKKLDELHKVLTKKVQL